MLLGWGCSNKNDLDALAERNPDLKIFVDSLETTSQAYKKCEECNLNGLEGKKLIGFTDRYPPYGHYDKKEIDIGDFDCDVYLISGKEDDNRQTGKMYICFFNREQKQKFKDFSRYFHNRVAHYKQFCEIQYINNTVIITIENHI